MPIYAYKCTCGWSGDLIRTIDLRDNGECPNCLRRPERQLAAPLGRVSGRTPQGGGADRFTADMLGVPLKELPPGLRTDQAACERSS